MTDKAVIHRKERFPFPPCCSSREADNPVCLWCIADRISRVTLRRTSRLRRGYGARGDRRSL